MNCAGARSYLLFSPLILLWACASAPPPEASAPIAIDGEPQALSGQRYLEVRVGVNISASPDRIWDLLTDAAAYPSWNSTVISIDGTIAPNNTMRLKSTVDPKRTFKLEVTEFKPATRMVWADGGRAFRGERTFVLTPRPNGTTDVTMAEVFTGSMMGMIAPKLPDFGPSFRDFAADLKAAAETPATQ